MSEDTNTTTQEVVECKHSFVQDSIMTRLKQESTWRGIITVATLLGWRLAPDQVEAIITTGAGLVAAINVLKHD